MAAEADAWQMVQRGGPIDAKRFLQSLRALAERPVLGPRDRLLLRDGFAAVDKHWRGDALQQAYIAAGLTIAHFQQADQSTDKGFLTLESRMADVTDPETFFQMLEDLGRRIRRPATLVIGGSMTLMIEAWVIRKTDDVDLVDEVPPPLRDEPELLDLLKQRYGLRIAHFQSHYLPAGWQRRLRALGKFGSITAMRVDPMDVLVCKLFSRRDKDMNDLVQAWPVIDKQAFRDRVAGDGKSLAADEKSFEAAKSNWKVLTVSQPFPL